jgi:hypothetical protein
MDSTPVKTTEVVYNDEYSTFSNRMRQYVTYLLGFVMVLSTLTTTIYFPLIPMLSRHYNTSILAINITVTIYAIFQALSPAIFAPLADTYGRRPVLLVLIIIYACGSIGIKFQPDSYSALLVFRALQSVGGSATISTSYGIVVDMAAISERGKILGPMLSTTNAISTVGPVIGGAIALKTDGVIWVFLSLFAISIVGLILVGFTLPETCRNIVGNGQHIPGNFHRTWWSIVIESARVRSIRGIPRVNEEDGQQAAGALPKLRLAEILGPLRIIFFPDALAVLWMIASSYSVYYTFQTAIPVIFDEIYGWNELQIGLSFLPGLIGLIMGGIVAGRWLDYNFAFTATNYPTVSVPRKGEILGDFPIEIARYRNCWCYILVEVAMILGYGWAVQMHVHPFLPLALQFFICGLGTILTHTATTLLVDIFPGQASTSYASGQIVRCGLSAGLSAALQPTIDAIGRGWYFVTFGLFIGLSAVISVSVSRTVGVQWRQKRLSC